MDMDGQDSQQPAQSFAHDTPPRADVDEILRRKRKAREYKACYPCRQRKVKCDQSVPCKTCVVREHPELCTYHPPAETHPPAKRMSMGVGHNGNDFSNGMVHIHGGTVTLPREDWDRICAKLQSAEKSLQDLKNSISSVSEVPPNAPINGFSPGTTGNTPLAAPAPIDNETSHVRTQGIHTKNDLTGQTIHIGPSSVPALVLALGRGEAQWPGVQDLLGKKSILPIFGLDNESATYPFVDLWGLPHGSIARAVELSNALPTDSECLSFFRCFRETAHVVYPAVADIEQFESDLLLFLINRAGAQPNGNTGVTEEAIFGKSVQWIGLLFAILASGCQCSTLPRKERELTSQVYVCCSFECLRFTNFLSHATLDSIQTLLILGNVISNNMNAGVAWSLMGLTVRLSQTLGLHRICPPSTPPQTKAVRTKTWWALLWQDSLLSISYDRASSTTTIDHTVPLSQTSTPGTRSYVESMYRVCKVGLDIVRERQRPQNSHDALLRITEHRNELQDIMFDAADYLKDSRRCRSMRDQLEHWALYLHISYITSELCRPAISPNAANIDLSKNLRKTCIDSLTNTVEAFLGLQNMTPFATRSWASVHRGISAGILLGILGEASRNERARSLLSNLVSVLGDITSGMDPAELSAPITRSISALQRLLSILDRTGIRKEEGSSSNQTSPSNTAINFEELNGAFTFEDPSFISHSPLANLEMDGSPYALMDSIIWGGKKTP